MPGSWGRGKALPSWLKGTGCHFFASLNEKPGSAVSGDARGLRALLDGKARFLYGSASIKVDLRLVRGKVPAAELF